MWDLARAIAPSALSASRAVGRGGASRGGGQRFALLWGAFGASYDALQAIAFLFLPPHWPHKLQNQYGLAATIRAWTIKALGPGRTRSLQREIKILTPKCSKSEAQPLNSEGRPPSPKPSCRNPEWVTKWALGGPHWGSGFFARLGRINWDGLSSSQAIETDGCAVASRPMTAEKQSAWTDDC